MPTPAQISTCVSAVARINGRAPTTSSKQTSLMQTQTLCITVLIGFRGECHSSKQFRKGKINGKEIVDTDKVLHMVLYHRGTKMDAKKKKKKTSIRASVVTGFAVDGLPTLGHLLLSLKAVIILSQRITQGKSHHMPRTVAA